MPIAAETRTRFVGMRGFVLSVEPSSERHSPI